MVLKPCKFFKFDLKTDEMVRWAGHYVPLRHRYVLTKDNRLRLRFVVSSVAVSALMAGAIIGGFAARPNSYTIHSGAPGALASLNGYGPEQKLAVSQKRLQRYALYEDDQDGLYGNIGLSAQKSEPQPKEKTLKIGLGDTLAGLLQKAGVSAGEAYSAVLALQDRFDPRQLKPGQIVHVRFDPGAEDGDGYQFSGLQLGIDALKSVSLVRGEDGAFQSALHEKEVVRRVRAERTPIEVSLYGSAEKAGIPASVVAQVLRILSWDVDFQRDIRKGDVLDVMYEQFETVDGEKVKSGEVVYARLGVNGQDIPVYRFEMENGDVDYFTAEGKSIRKALMKTPVDGARLSSGFGMRKHPVLGYNKMHKGVDFAASIGTPIYAAGDGTIEKAGRWSSYGNYIRIRHTGGLKTAYAHMNGFAKGIQAGSRVKQGQVIGYLGMTGRVTGPHLHFEVMMNGAQIDPKSVKMQQGESLKGRQLEAFKKMVDDVDRQYASLISGTKVASRIGGQKSSTTLR